jgi:glycosyltransferase involved in cell wall biosynthesis
MKIVIDLQGRQSRDSKYRGIGRYSLSITKAIIRNKKEHEIFVVVSDAFEDTIDEIENELSNILEKSNFFIWNASKNSSFMNSDIKYRNSEELSRELFIHNLNPDLIYITSLFEGFHDDVVTSVHSIASTIPTVVTLYDLIPLMNKEIYLENNDVRNWYEGKLKHLKRADLLLSISESSRQEALDYLHSNPNDVINIRTAADEQFKKLDISIEEKTKVTNKYSIEKDFLMYTGGIDHRKNIEGLIYSYSLLSENIRKEHQLAIVCSIDENQRNILEKIITESGLEGNEVIFTGFIPEKDLIILYNVCKAFIFPSWHEGFGLPALEAMHCGVPVIASNSSSLPEVIGLKEALFDAKDKKDMSKKIEEVLTNEEFRNSLIEHAKEQIKVFTWDNSGKIAIEAFEKIYNKKKIKKYSSDRLKLAFISPLPPEHTGIADYSAELIPFLYDYYDIDVIIDQEKVSDEWIIEHCNILNIKDFIDNLEKYDRVLYHFGNSHFHQHMFKLIKDIPGVVVLHDFFLSGILHYASSNENKFFSFEDELAYSHGNINLDNNACELIMKYPCNKRVIDNSLGIIVHSEYSRKLAKDWYGENYSLYWEKIPLLRISSSFDKKISRNKLNINEDDFLICSFGIVDKTKQNHRLLDSWIKSSLSKDKNCKLLFVGEYLDEEYGKDLIKQIKLKNNENVKIIGRVDNNNFRDYLSSADIGVQLRTSSRGETSAAVLDCMNYNLATIVNANGSMADLPNDSVLMLSDEFNDEDLIEALEKLYKNEKDRILLGNKAKEVIETKHSPEKCAYQYAKVIENFYTLIVK